MTWLTAGVIVFVVLMVDNMVSNLCKTWLAAQQYGSALRHARK